MLIRGFIQLFSSVFGAVISIEPKELARHQIDYAKRLLAGEVPEHPAWYAALPENERGAVLGFFGMRYEGGAPLKAWP